MKTKNTEQLQREIRRLKRENQDLKREVAQLEKDNDRLRYAKEIAESLARSGERLNDDL